MKEIIHEFEVKMGKWRIISNIIMISIFSILSIVYYFKTLDWLGYNGICLIIFWANQFIILMVLKLFKNTKIMRRYLLHRATKKNEGCLCIILEFVFLMIPTYLHPTWYNIIITILMSIAYEYLSRDITVTQNYTIE